MLGALKLKPYDLEPVFASWHDAPKFFGEPRRDPPVETWLDQIKAGCQARNIPEEHWHKVGKHYLGPKAAGRFSELKKVLTQMNGGKYRWTWKKFRTAMMNMGWNIDSNVTETIEVKSKGSNFSWRILSGGKKDQAPPAASPNPKQEIARPSLQKNSKTEVILPSSRSSSLRPSPQKSKTTDSSYWLKRSTTKSSKDFDVDSTTSSHGHGKPTRESKDDLPERPVVMKSHTVSESSPFWSTLTRKHSSDGRPGHGKAFSESEIHTRGANGPVMISEADVTTVANAPKWLIEACGALDFLTSEHPKAMSFISAVLVTVGSIPTIPAVAAGAGGAILASGTAQAIGAVAVGLGSWMHAQQNGNDKGPGQEQGQAHH